MSVWAGVNESLSGDSIPAISSIYGIPFFLGVSALNQGSILSFDKYTDIRGKLGTGPLTREIEDFFACGGQKSKAFAKVLTPDIPGTVSSVTSETAGDHTATASGNPTDAYDIVVEIVSGGALGSAVAKYSYDGGNSWSEKITVPSDGVLALGITGVSITISGTGDLTTGDKFTLTTTAPQASTSVVLEAISEVLDSYRGQFEFLVIVGPSAASFWTSVDLLMAEEWNRHNPIFALLEASLINESSVASDIANLTASAQTFSSRYVMITAAQAEMKNVLGESLERPLAGSAAGILSKGKVSDSIGVLRDDFGKIRPATKILPEALTESDLRLLNDARFTVPRKYEGYPGFFFNNGNLMSPPGDPFDSVEKIRVAAKMMRLMRIAALRNLHLDADSTGSGSFGGVAGLEYLRQELLRAVQPMFDNGELYKCEPEILSPPEDVFLDKTVRVNVKFSTNPKMKSIELVFNLISPDEF